MNTNEQKKSLLIALFSKVLMIGGGILLCWTINDLYGATSALVTLMLVFFFFFIYVFGASLIGRGFRFKNVFHPHHEIRDGIMFAFLLMAAGALMVCFNTELLNPVWKPFFISWQMALFIAGAICMCRSHITFGILLSTTGIFFLIEKAAIIYPGVIHYENFTKTYWPAVFIIAGIAIVISFVIRPAKCCKKYPKGNWIDDYIPGEHENNDGKINYRFVFSGTEQVILDPVFKGGTIEATFGGMELDLRRTSLPEGKTYLYITTVFGGVDIKAPDHWDIEFASKSFAGGVSDSRMKGVDVDHSRKLIIVAKCTFGGITLR
jgi:predicted membrane protein